MVYQIGVLNMVIYRKVYFVGKEQIVQFIFYS